MTGPARKWRAAVEDGENYSTAVAWAAYEDHTGAF
jgi:hypothetical protein